MIELKWLGILVCLGHSAMFSGLNLGFFGLSRLRLEIQAESGHTGAGRILSLRKDSHFLLSTLLWGNVASNVLLTLLTDSFMTGIAAFALSTVGITFFGEIIPQAYLARNVLQASNFLIPVVRFYQVVLFPVAKLTASILDFWLGREGVTYWKEKEISILLRRHAQSGLSEISDMESLGAINFLALDDTKIEEEGEIVHPKSIVELPSTPAGLPVFPDYERSKEDPFLQKIHASHKKWVIITDEKGEPQLVLDADHFLLDVSYGKEILNVYSYCHRPIIVKAPETKLGQVMLKFKVHAQHAEDDVIDHDLILYWGKDKRIITGSDILGRLLRGIVPRIIEEKMKKSDPPLGPI